MTASYIKMAIAALLFTIYMVFSVLEKAISLYMQLAFPFITERTPLLRVLIPVLGLAGMHALAGFVSIIMGLGMFLIVYVCERTSIAHSVGKLINIVYLSVYIGLVFMTIGMIDTFINNWSIMTRWI